MIDFTVCVILIVAVFITAFGMNALMTPKRVAKDNRTNDLIDAVNYYNGVAREWNDLSKAIPRIIDKKRSEIRPYLSYGGEYVDAWNKISKCVEKINELSDDASKDFEQGKTFAEMGSVVGLQTCIDRVIDTMVKVRRILGDISKIRVVPPSAERQKQFATGITAGYFKGCETKAEVQKTYRRLVKKLHPDNGGSEKDFSKLTEEYKSALREVRK